MLSQLNDQPIPSTLPHANRSSKSISIRCYLQPVSDSLLWPTNFYNPPQTCHHKKYAASKGVEPRSIPITHGPGTNVAPAPEDEEPPVDDADAGAVAAEPRLKVGEGRVVSVAAAVVALAGGAVTAAPLSERMSVAVELAPGRAVPDGRVGIVEA